MTHPITPPAERPSTEQRPIPFGRPVLSATEVDLVNRVLHGTQLTQGPIGRRFESDFAAFTGAPHAVATSSCMGALHLSYLFLGLQPGDEVIVPAQTHVATAMAVELCGGRCVFVDAEPATGNVDLAAVEAHVTANTRAISVVHFLGMPVDMHRLSTFARTRELFVVEDCALALGATCGGVHVGLLGDAGAFSFYPAKHITTGEGGMLISRRADVAHAAARQRAFGVQRGDPGVVGADDYDVLLPGLNYRMSELAAALGVGQLQRLPGFLAARRANYRVLTEALAGIDEIRCLQSSHDHLESAFYCHCIVLEGRLARRRGEITAYLRSRGIGVSVYYPRPVPRMTYFKEKYGTRAGDFPVASSISDSSIALPVGQHLDTDDMAHIAETVLDAIATVSRQ